MIRSLQAKLLLNFMGIILLVLCAVLFSVSFFIRTQTLASKQQELLAAGAEFAGLLSSYQDISTQAELDSLLDGASSSLDLRIWVLNESRKVVRISGPPQGNGMMKGKMMHHRDTAVPPEVMMPSASELDAVYQGQVWTKVFNSPYYGEKMIMAAVPIRQADGGVHGALLLHAPASILDSFMENIYFYIIAAGLLAALFALFISYQITRSMIRPLKAMQQTATAIASGDYHLPVPITTSDEIGQLGQSLNALANDLKAHLATLEHAEKLRRDFVANVSHELRTPLTILRGYTEALLDGTIEDPIKAQNCHELMLEETKRLERLISDLLDLSRLQSGKAILDKEFLPLPLLAEHALQMMAQTASQKKVHLQLQADTNLPLLYASSDRISQLLLILLDNAVKFTPAGKNVQVKIRADETAMLLEVSDAGNGISPEDLPHIWERFYKADKAHARSEDGTGLGLAIARQIIDLHQATVEVTSQLAAGTRISIRFPLPSEKRPQP